MRNYNRIIGIDAGMSGGIAVYTMKPQSIFVGKMPTITKQIEKRKRNKESGEMDQDVIIGLKLGNIDLKVVRFLLKRFLMTK